MLAALLAVLLVGAPMWTPLQDPDVYYAQLGAADGVGDGVPSVANLPSVATVRCHGGDATAGTWVCEGATFEDAGGGADPTVNLGGPLLGSDDDSVSFTADGYQVGDTTTGNVATSDFGLSLVIEATGTTSVIAAKRDGAVGWEIGIDASDRLYLTLQDADSNSTTVSAALTAGRWYFAEVFADRDGNAQWYVNGSASGAAVDISGEAPTLDSATALTLGDDSGLDNTVFDGKLAYFALDIGSAALDTTSFALLNGTYAQKAVGSNVPTFTRATGATLRKSTGHGYDTRLYTVGAGWPRVEDLVAECSDVTDPDCVSSEFYYSEDLSHSSWTKVAATIDTSCAVTHRGRCVQGIVGTAVDTTHAISSGLAPPANYTHPISAVCTPGARDSLRISSTNLGSFSVWAQFDCDTCTVGLTSSPTLVLDTDTETQADGACRVHMAYDGGTAAHTHLFVPIDDAGVDDTTWTGDGSTVDLYVTELQHDLSTADTGYTGFRPYVRTAGAMRHVQTNDVTRGYLAETASQNEALQSEDIATSWTKTNAGDTLTTNASQSPANTMTGDAIVSDATDTTHLVQQAVTLTADTWTGSAYAHLGVKTWTYVADTTVANATGYVNLTACAACALGVQCSAALGTKGAGATTLFAEYIGDGWCRYGLSVTGTVAAHTWQFGPAHADTDNDFAGDGSSVSIYLWGAQVEKQTRPTSYVGTTTVAVSRNGDVIDYTLTAAAQRGSVTVEMICPPTPLRIGSVPISLSDGTSANSVYVFVGTGATVSLTSTAIASVVVNTAVGSVNLFDETWHTIGSEWTPGTVANLVDGARDPETPSAVTGIPSTMTVLGIGHLIGGASYQSGCHYRNVRISR